MTENQEIAYHYLKGIGSYNEFRPVDFFLMVQDTAMTIQECSLALDELDKLRTIDTVNSKEVTTFKLRDNR